MPSAGSAIGKEVEAVSDYNHWGKPEDDPRVPETYVYYRARVPIF
jgi:hypothetical protein